MPKPNRIPTPEGCKCCSCGYKCVHPLGPVLPANSDHFARNRTNPDGLQSDCKQCSAARHARYYYTHLEQVKAQSRKWRRENPERHREMNRRDQKKRASQVAAYQKGYWAEHQEKRSDIGARYYENHPERVKASNERWRSEHPEMKRAAKHRRRARERGLPATFTGEQHLHSLDYFQDVCAYCGKPPRPGDRYGVLQADHFIPLADANCPGTVVENMLPVCQLCNHQKHARDPYKWLLKRFGEAESQLILQRVSAYFDSVTEKAESSG